MARENTLGFLTRWVPEKPGVIYSRERRKLQLQFNRLFNEIALPNGVTLDIERATDLVTVNKGNQVVDAFMAVQTAYKGKEIDDAEATRRLTGIKTCMAAQLHLIS